MPAELQVSVAEALRGRLQDEAARSDGCIAGFLLGTHIGSRQLSVLGVVPGVEMDIESDAMEGLEQELERMLIGGLHCLGVYITGLEDSTSKQQVVDKLQPVLGSLTAPSSGLQTPRVSALQNFILLTLEGSDPSSWTFEAWKKKSGQAEAAELVSLGDSLAGWKMVTAHVPLWHTAHPYPDGFTPRIDVIAAVRACVATPSRGVLCTLDPTRPLAQRVLTHPDQLLASVFAGADVRKVGAVPIVPLQLLVPVGDEAVIGATKGGGASGEMATSGVAVLCALVHETQTVQELRDVLMQDLDRSLEARLIDLEDAARDTVDRQGGEAFIRSGGALAVEGSVLLIEAEATKDVSFTLRMPTRYLACCQFAPSCVLPLCDYVSAGEAEGTRRTELEQCVGAAVTAFVALEEAALVEAEVPRSAGSGAAAGSRWVAVVALLVAVLVAVLAVVVQMYMGQAEA